MKTIKKYQLGLLLGILTSCIGVVSGQQIRLDSAEQIRLAARSEAAKIMRQQKQDNLYRRAQQLQIPMQKVRGGVTMTLRSITPAGEAIYDAIDNNISQETSAADSVKNGGGLRLNLSGAGQTLGIWEAFETGTGATVRGSHQEFGGRATIVDNGTFSRHATHVAGTMIAGGMDPAAQGFSHAANLRCFDLTNDVDEMDDEAQNTPIRISNHSYGTRSGWSFNNTTGMWDWNGQSGETEDWKFGAYNDDAQDWDRVTFDNPFLTVFKSAGNDRGDGPAATMDGGADGFDCIPTYGTAKNIVSVGAIDDIAGGYTGPASVRQINTSFSGWGPTDDGRIKPDIVANGDGLWSATRTGDDQYTSLSGTSMASPSAAGGAGLLLEHFGNVIGGVPRSATMKGLMIHEADEAGTALGPDYSTGWGLMNIGDAAQLISIEGYDGCRQLVTGSVGDGDVFNYDIFSSGNQPLKITLTWTDPESGTTNNGTINPAGANYLVNNLDLSLIQGGNTFRPWVLDPANPGNNATTGINNRDNVEQVFIMSPAAGQYTIRITAPATVSDGPQQFTLWLSGNDAEDDNKNISGVVYLNTQTIAARNTISFGPSVTVASGAQVRAFAGRTVSLKPGFTAMAGSKFNARIMAGGGCGNFSGNLKVDNYVFTLKNDLTDARQEQSGADVQDIYPVVMTATPNPFKEQCIIRFDLPEMQKVSLQLIDLHGNTVQEWYQQETLSAGQHQVDLQQFNLPAGVYFAQLRTNNTRQVLKIVKVSQ